MSEKVTINFGSPLVVIVRSEPDKPPIRPIVTLDHPDLPLTISGENMSETVQQGHIGTISVEWTNAQGQPAKVDGPTTWNSTDESIITVTVATGNPLIANWHTVGLGSASILATADADMGDGVKKITATTDFTVIPGEATGGTTTVEDLGPGEPSSGGPQARRK